MDLPEGFETWSLEAKQKFVNELKYNWKYWARPNQLPPEGDWDGWLLLAGRGFGKTRAACEWVKEKLLAEPNTRVGIIGMTIGAARDTDVEGESGLLSIIPQHLISKWNRSLGQLRLTNGSACFIFGSTDPDRLRGFQCHYMLFDELAAFADPSAAFDQALMTLRLGRHPQWVAATTPRPIPLIVELHERSKTDPDVIKITTGSTFENTNLPDGTLRALRARYEGTSIGRQELMGALVFDNPGALWNRELLDRNRVPRDGFEVVMNEIVVAIDPMVNPNAQRDTECGIVVCGRGTDGHGYVLEDGSMMRPSPDAWASRAVYLYHKWHANKLVAESNMGGDLVKHTIHTVDRDVPIKMVRASHQKMPRAQPIVALYEQGKVHHVGEFIDLEDQLVQWEPKPGHASPDRLDAMVWGFTQVLLGGGLAEFFAPTTESIGRLPSIFRQ